MQYQKQSRKHRYASRRLLAFGCKRMTMARPGLVSLWIDPLMKAFEPHDALREAEITANPTPFSDDEPPSWKTLNEDAIVVHAYSVKNLN